MRFDLTTFTAFHVALSLIALASGFVVVAGLTVAKRLDGWTAVFLATTVLTSVTGFLFPVAHFLPSHAVGIVSVIVLAAALRARYVQHLEGTSRRIYVIAAVVALYLNAFVAVVQAFRRVPALTALAPTQSEPPFAAVQLAVLLMFVALGYVATKNFRERAGSASGAVSV